MEFMYHELIGAKSFSTGKYSCLYDACSRATGMTKLELREAVIMSMDRSPSSYTSLIQARNYLASTEMGKNYVMSGGYAEPRADLAKYYMVGGEIVRDEELGKELHRPDLKTLKERGEEINKQFEEFAGEGYDRARSFVRGLDEVGQTLLLSMVPAEKLFHYGFTGIKIAKDSKLVANLLPKIANQKKTFVGALKNTIDKIYPSKITRASKEIEKYLGKNPRFINNNGNITIMSRDGKRQVRFDFERLGDDKPHFHLRELKKNGKFGDAIKNIHRIYFKK